MKVDEFIKLPKNADLRNTASSMVVTKKYVLEQLVNRIDRLIAHPDPGKEVPTKEELKTKVESFLADYYFVSSSVIEKREQVLLELGITKK